MSYNIDLSVEARLDLIEIYQYVAFHLLEPATAKKLYEYIISEIHTLDTFPNRNSLIESEPLRSKGIRKLPVKNYVVLYTVDNVKMNVNIARIMYGGRDIVKQLGEL